MKYTRPDLMYDVNRFSSHDSDTSAPAFEGIKNLIRYLSVCTHLPITYTSGLNENTTNGLHQEVSPCDFHSKKRSTGLVVFVDEGEGHIPQQQTHHNLRNPLSFWWWCSLVSHNSTSLCSPFHRLRSSHLLNIHQHFPMAPTHPKQIIFQVYDAPTPIYEYTQPTIDNINANNLTSRVKKIAFPIHYVHDNYVLLIVYPVKLKPPFRQ